MQHLATSITAVAAGIALSVGSATAQENPRMMPDDTWISLSGAVTSASENSFRMDYGDGLITVEMDDWDEWADALPLADGDQVTVYGEVDANLYEDDTIEASSVYVDDLNSFFYASAADEEDIGTWAVDTVDAIGDVTYVGTVETVDKTTDTFTIDTGATELTVYTDPLLYDPLDGEGFQKIESGDRVSVDGVVDSDFFGNSDLVADSIVTLED